MSTASVPGGRPMAKKREPRMPGVPADPPPERLEVQVPAGWIKLVDAAAHKKLLSRSDYVRLAVLAALKADGMPAG
jgi:hypothetical protein